MAKKFSRNKEKAISRANELMNQARATSGIERINLAKRAIDVNPDCVDAYLLLGDDEDNLDSSVVWYHKAVEAGRRMLGKDFFTQNEGKFWRNKKARSFIIALHTLANELVYHHKYHEAIDCYQELLHLDRSDHEGVRFDLYRVLMSTNQYAQARDLLDAYQDNNDERWLYNDLLLSYFEQGINNYMKMKAQRAIAYNEQVCQLLLEPMSLIEAHRDIDLSDMDSKLADAVNYLIEAIELWNSEPQLLVWLRKLYYGLDDDKMSIKKPESIDDLKKLLNRGNELIETGDLREAEKLLAQALAYKENLMVRNSLGYCKLLMQKYQEALIILIPGLDSGKLNPFGCALASECAFNLQDEFNAYRFLKQAIRDFDKGMRTAEDVGQFADNWLQYTVIIKAVAGLLGNDKLVIDLHKKWDSYLILEEDTFQLGVAYFNCGQYNQAARIWAQIGSPEWSFLDKFKKSAELFAKGIIPPPRLEYLPPWYLMDSEEDGSIKGIIGKYASYQVLLITELFEDITDNSSEKHVHILILSTLGSWGEKFGKAIIGYDELHYKWKLAAVIGLMSQGVFQYGDSVKFKDNHKWVELIIDEELMNQFFEGNILPIDSRSFIYELYKNNNYESIIAMLAERQEKGMLDYQLIHILASSYFYIGKTDKAVKLAVSLEELCNDENNPERDFCCLAVADLWLSLDEPERSCRWITQISVNNLTEHDLNHYQHIFNKLQERRIAVDYPASIKAKINQLLEKRIPENRDLDMLLKGLPDVWFNGVCTFYGIKLTGKREQREKKLRSILSDQDYVDVVIEGLSSSENELLNYIKSKNGVAKLAPITRYFGDIRQDSYNWANKIPQTALGSLCYKGLVFVGTLTLNGNNYKVAVLSQN